MSNILLLDQTQELAGLGTMTYTAPSAGQYFVLVQLTEVPVSGLSVVVNKNGGPIFTNPVITPTQIAQQFKVGFQLAASDVVTVVLSSALPIDSQLNNVKSNITIGTGP